MATLRAAALTLNGALLVAALWALSNIYHKAETQLLVLSVLFATPLVNDAVILLQARRSD
jgi:hypothetical protein